MGDIAIGLVCVWVGYHMGWRNAHLTVAKECERLGKFFVGKTVYECTKICPDKSDTKTVDTQSD